MKKLILILGLIVPLFSIAQLQWFPVGAEWYYGSANGSYINGKVVKDTIVNAIHAKKIDYQNADEKTVMHEIFAERNDTVFFFDKKSKDFVRVYNFNAKVGDTMAWVTSSFPGLWSDYTQNLNELKSVVSSIDTIEVSGYKLPWYTTKALGKYSYGSTNIT